MKIAAVVLNSVSHDARVIKEAVSLGRAGHSVTLIGICDQKNPKTSERLRPEFDLIRVNWLPKRQQWFKFAKIFMLAIGLALFVTAMWFAKSICDFIVQWLYPWIYYGVFAAAIFVFLMKGRIRTMIVSRVNLKAIRSAIFDKLKELRPEAVHCHDLIALPIGYEYKKKYGGKLIYDSHEIFECTVGVSHWRKFVYESMQRKFSRIVDGFITVNDSIAKFLNEKYPSLPKAQVVMNAAPAVSEKTSYDGRLHRAAGLDGKAKILLYQGGFSPFRGLEILVESAPLLPDGWAMVMMGWGKIEAKLKALAAGKDSQGARIRFIGGAPQPELLHWTRGATVGIIPYENSCLNHWFCTPNKIWEYAAAGVPMLVSPFPELGGAVKEADMGWLLSDPIKPAGIAGVISGITEDELARKKENALKFAAKDHWGIYENRLVGLYRGMSVQPA